MPESDKNVVNSNNISDTQGNPTDTNIDIPFSPSNSFGSALNHMRLQSQLGKEVQRVNQEGSSVVRLALARIDKVNYKYNTVEVVTTRNRTKTNHNPVHNGRYSARLPVKLGGTIPSGKPYGSTTLITRGSLVLIGFIEGNKDVPIVLNVYSDSEEQSLLTRTTLTEADERDESLQRELWQIFNLYPSMTYDNMDGRGSKEITFSGKTFMYLTDTDPLNEYVQDYGFDYQDLPNSKYANGELIEPTSPISPTLLYVHQGVYDQHRVTIFIKSDGTFRIASRHTDGRATYTGFNERGEFVLTPDKEPPKYPEKVDPSIGVSYAEVRTNGEVIIEQKKTTSDPDEPVSPDKLTHITISPGGEVNVHSRNDVNINALSTVNITAPRINLN